jgi:catechol 2,3-dioxygenase-like lactoylglutathione lyase family enzyme
MPALAVERIDHLVLRVADLERAIAFYTRALGFTVARRRDDLGLVHLRAGASMVDLVSLDGSLGKRGGRGPELEGRNVDHFCLRVEPFDEAAIVAHLNACGLPLPEKATVNFGAEGDGPSLYIQDPDGNTIELKGPTSVCNGA